MVWKRFCDSFAAATGWGVGSFLRYHATLSQVERWWVRTERTDLVRFLAQDSSYWAIKLPHGWWVFGLDNALQEDIDTLQVMYVCLCKCAMLTGAVLCTPPPPFSTNTLHSLLLQWTQMTAS